jgi:hypothetical protein
MHNHMEQVSLYIQAETVHGWQARHASSDLWISFTRKKQGSWLEAALWVQAQTVHGWQARHCMQ